VRVTRGGASDGRIRTSRKRGRLWGETPHWGPHLEVSWSARLRTQKAGYYRKMRTRSNGPGRPIDPGLLRCYKRLRLLVQVMVVYLVSMRQAKRSNRQDRSEARWERGSARIRRFQYYFRSTVAKRLCCRLVDRDAWGKLDSAFCEDVLRSLVQ
jgi:hypothetical protein